MKFLVLGVYFALLLGIGYISMKKTKNLNDFFLGGRSVGPWLSAFSYGAAYFSAVLFIGYAGKIGWGFGLSALWIALGNALVGCLLAWYFLARRTRAMTVNLEAMTMPGFLEKRYQSSKMRIFSALVIFIFLVPYCASVYMGLSYLFESVFGIPYIYALFLIAGITALYLTMGGYFALTFVDFIQGSVMILGVIFMVHFVVASPEVGGWMNFYGGLAEIGEKFVAPVGPPGFVPLAALVVLTSLGPWGLPQMVQKFYAIKSEEVIKTSTIITTIFALLIGSGAYFTGSLSRLFFGSLEEVGGKVDMLMPEIITSALPEMFAVLILLLVLSASMSTLASLVLVSSSSISVDLVQYIWPGITRRRIMQLMRVLCLVFIGFSLYLALTPTIILNLMAVSWGTVAGVFLAPYVYGLWSKRVTKAGAWAGMVTGFLISTIFSYLYPGQIPLVGSLAMVVPLVVVPLVSAFTSRFSEEHIDFVFKAIEK